MWNNVLWPDETKSFVITPEDMFGAKKTHYINTVPTVKNGSSSIILQAVLIKMEETIHISNNSQFWDKTLGLLLKILKEEEFHPSS